MKLNLYPKLIPAHLDFTQNPKKILSHKYITPQIIRDAVDTITFNYTIHKQLSHVKNKHHLLEFRYDLLNKVVTQIQDNIEIHYREECIPHYEYKTFLNHTLTTKHYTKERKKTLELDNLGIIALSYTLPSKTRTRTETIAYPNGHKEIYTFIGHELVSLKTANQTFTYKRDSLGRIIQLNNIAYKYDVLDRLTMANKTKFKYDKAGNNEHLQAKYHRNTYQILENHTYIYQYDKRGNLKQKVNKKTQEERHYGFNLFNQLEEYLIIDSNGHQIKKIRYTYDGLNRRISKNEDGILHYYLYDKENIIAILNEDKQELATIIHHPTKTDTPLSITTKEGTYFYHRNHQGSIIALSDKNAKIVEIIEYDSHYGKIQNHTKLENTFNPYGYTGREIDSNDLYYYRARYYDPNIGQFISSDPIRFASGDFNFYRYVSNDPVNFTDPSGLILAGGTGDDYARELQGKMVNELLKHKQQMADIQALKKWGPKEETLADKYGDAAGLCLAIGAAFTTGGTSLLLSTGGLIIDIEQGDGWGIASGVFGMTGVKGSAVTDIGYGAGALF